ncbi:hypothetical protein R1sor_005869 [Riccia sorocarpa]|uniref:DUF7869 domain-containing protein n=1 Tax=Riccia sorocarpa TaxID=122646 RepID=A0ABD3HLF7_9MARC
MLLDRNIFSKIKLGFLLVGHTHDFVDQMFSRFSQALRHENAFTMSRLFRIAIDKEASELDGNISPASDIVSADDEETDFSGPDSDPDVQ